MKILHVCSGKGLGGTRTVFLSYQELFEAAGVYATPVVRSGAAVEAQLKGTGARDVEVLDYFRRYPIRWQKAYARMQHLAETHDVIWTHKPVDTYIWRQIAPNAKIVMVVHGFQNTNLKKADCLIAVSNPVLAHLERKDLGNVFLIENFLATPVTKHEIGWHIPIKISSFGFFRRKKGFTDLIKAVSILEQKQECSRNFSVNIYGGGRLSATLKLMKFWLRPKNLSINKWADDVPALLRETDIVVIPSRSESFSMIAIEAMSQGCLVVATKSGGPEFIITNNVDGILVEKLDPAGLAEAIFKCLQNPQDFTQMREKGRQTVAARFTVEKAMSSLKEILEAIAD
ncbi:MAG: glycosyltransferase family 4 protein [Holosporales bacterium]|jgi:glycosyltransferase involved in cell wall biosynthesis|nr:glycosyltransferase family 4 protein [Holosporales bacterium]